MNELRLKLEDQNEIDLPDWIGGTTLTLAEIGAVACLGCLQAGSEVPEVMERIGTLEMAEAMQSLKAKGVLSATMNGNRVTMEIDLDAVLPSSLQNADVLAKPGTNLTSESNV
jgi:hypothetical protein